METKDANRNRTIGIRLTAQEYLKVEKGWKASTCRKLSDYVRRIIFDRPITTFYRDKSKDDMLAEMSKLRMELNHLGNNFNQAVKRLHTLQGESDIKQWLQVYDLEKRVLLNKVEDIKNHSKKLVEKWLQS